VLLKGAKINGSWAMNGTMALAFISTSVLEWLKAWIK
jgi:hypothetical protein